MTDLSSLYPAALGLASLSTVPPLALPHLPADAVAAAAAHRLKADLANTKSNCRTRLPRPKAVNAKDCRDVSPHRLSSSIADEGSAHGEDDRLSISSKHSTVSTETGDDSPAPKRKNGFLAVSSTLGAIDNLSNGGGAKLSTASLPAAGRNGSRKRGRALPDDLKDETYWERRRKNNEAAKKSRDTRRAKEDEIAVRCAFLEQENVKLRVEVTQLAQELTKLKAELVVCKEKKKQSTADTEPGVTTSS